jgi:hypothetical protein
MVIPHSNEASKHSCRSIAQVHLESTESPSRIEGIVPSLREDGEADLIGS